VSPDVFRYEGIKFHFFANEGTPREPIHIHASKAGCTAKFWLRPEVSLASNIGYASRELAAIEKVVRQRRDAFEKAWNEFFREGR
jgi:hypothetical protein